MAFDPAAATAAHLAALGPEQLARAAAYTSGSNWILVLGVPVSLLVAVLLLKSRLLLSLHGHLSLPVDLSSAIVSAVAILLVSLLTLPWTFWSQYLRDRHYGRSSQPAADWLLQGGLSLLLTAVLGGLFFAGLYWLIRHSPQHWWLWAGGLVALGISVLLLAGPPLIEPLFNRYQTLPDGPLRTALQQQAQAAGVPVARIFVYDGSRQSNNFTANVSGMFGTARIAISDVALKGASLAEVEAVTGHEIGHYVLGHVWRTVALYSLLAVGLFCLIGRLFPPLARLLGSPLPLAEPAALPLLLFLMTAFALLAQSLAFALSRHSEAEADRYSLETVNLPDALASALVKTADYRDPFPTPLEEWLFYTHPSVSRRVRAAMEWKATHPPRPAGQTGN